MKMRRTPYIKLVFDEMAKMVYFIVLIIIKKYIIKRKEQSNAIKLVFKCLFSFIL